MADPEFRLDGDVRIPLMVIISTIIAHELFRLSLGKDKLGLLNEVSLVTDEVFELMVHRRSQE